MNTVNILKEWSKHCCRPGIRRKAGLAVFFFYAAASASAQFMTPLHIGTAQQITDEFGQTLKGTAATPGDLVQILETDGGAVHPPAIDGTPHPNNPIITTTGIGNLAAGVDRGIFGLSCKRNGADPINSKQIFARVFNASSTSASSFYGDSQIFDVDTENTPFVVILDAADEPLDPADNDFDGLSNSLEKSLATNPNDADTDDDGSPDGDELRAGTDGLDADSVFVVVQIMPSGDDCVLRWDSVPGKSYQVERTSDELRASPIFLDVSPVIAATENSTAFTNVNGLLENLGSYRVRLVEE